MTANYTPPPGAAGAGGDAGATGGGDDRQNAEGDIGDEGEELGEPEPDTLPDGTPNPNAGKRKRFAFHFLITYFIFEMVITTNKYLHK